MPLFIIEFLFVLVLAIFLSTQIIFPLFGFFNGRTFWVFRSKEEKISKQESKLGELEVEKEQILLDKQIKEKEEELDKLKS